MIVIVYGYEGSGHGHWQRRLAAELQERGAPFEFPELSDPLAPQKDQWLSELDECVHRASGSPVTFVAHSLGCWAVDHFLAERGANDAHAALLVAPPSPYLLFEAVQTFMPPPMSKDAWAPIAERSVLVGSDNDDYAGSDEHVDIAATLGIAHRVVPGAAHLNTDAGYGPWPLPLEWLQGVGAVSA